MNINQISQMYNIILYTSIDDLIRIQRTRLELLADRL